MLRQLQIKNFALIDTLAIEFAPTLNVLTGETGAGKSILIDAIRFVLGERVESPPARSPDQPASVEAVFEVPSKNLRAHPLLAPFLENETDDLILRRELVQGRNRCLINQQTVNVSHLKEIGRLVIDIHGQYDHQLLFEAAAQMDLIDRLGKIDLLEEKYTALYAEYALLQKRKTELLELEGNREREADLLKYQIEEIEQARLQEREEETLKEERTRLANSERLHQVLSSLLSLLSEDSGSASALIAQAHRHFSELARIDSSMNALKNEYVTVQLNLEEIIRSLQRYQEDLSFEPDRLQEIDNRLDLIDGIKRKYGGEISKVNAFMAQVKKRYDELVNSTLYVKEIDQKLNAVRPRLQEQADEMSEKRKKTGTALKRIIEEELTDLGISHAKFQCQVDLTGLTAKGQDRLEFMVSLNPGERVFPLRKIVSAGEVSRIMLALKRALMNVDPVPTLIFDEIDANIGGRLGTVTGRKLKEISAERQVLLITHLPQIASFADCHFKVTKKVVSQKTLIHYEQIDGELRIKELAQMMSGQRETDISKKHAEEMLSRVRSQ